MRLDRWARARRSGHGHVRIGPTAPAAERRRVLPADERRRRKRQIAEAHDGGATWPVIAERFGLSERHARRAYADHLAEAGRVVHVDADEALRKMVQIHVWALDELRSLAATADNDSARVGAVRSRVAVSHDLIKLDRTGVLDPDDELVMRRLKAEQRRFVAAAMNVLEAHGVPLEEVEVEFDWALVGGRGMVVA